MTHDLGKVLLITGILFIVIGLFFMFRPQIPWLGKLPGDIYVKRGNFQFYFPIVTCILISLLITLVLYIFRRG
jgi:hypothetical protein